MLKVWLADLVFEDAWFEDPVNSLCKMEFTCETFTRKIDIQFDYTIWLLHARHTEPVPNAKLFVAKGDAQSIQRD